MALSPSRRAHPDGGLQCHYPWRQQEKNKKNHSANKPQTGAPVAAAAAAGGQNLRGKHPCQQCGDFGSCPVHPRARHSTSECCEILKFTERVSKRREQASKDDSSPPQRSGKEKVFDADAATAEKELGYQTPKKDLKGLYAQSNSESGVTSAARSCTSCMAAARSSSPGETSRLFAGKFSW
jgi:hypothetical protein